MDSELVRSLDSITGVDDPALAAEIRDEAATLLRGAEAVTRRLLGGYRVNDRYLRWVDTMGMRRPSPRITSDEAAWLAYMEDRSDA